MVVIKNDFVQNVLQKWETQTSDIRLLCNVGTLRLATVQCTFHWKKYISFVHTYVEMWNPVRLSLGNAVLCFIQFYQYDFHSGNPTHIHMIFKTRSFNMHFVCMECFFTVDFAQLNDFQLIYYKCRWPHTLYHIANRR